MCWAKIGQVGIHGRLFGVCYLSPLGGCVKMPIDRFVGLQSGNCRAAETKYLDYI
jgi:hypothetical protein